MLKLGQVKRVRINLTPGERLENDVGFGDGHRLDKTDKVIMLAASVFLLY